VPTPIYSRGLSHSTDPLTCRRHLASMLGSTWGNVGAMLWLSCGHIEAILGQFGALLGHIWGHIGQLEASLGPAWAILGHLGAILGPSGPSSGPYGEHRGAIFAHLGPSWGHLGANVGPTWGYMGAISRPRWSKRRPVRGQDKLDTAISSINGQYSRND
jgi:hypothetical protein